MFSPKAGVELAAINLRSIGEPSMMRFLQGTISYPEAKWGKPEDRAAKNTPLAKFVKDLAGIGADGIELWGRHLEGLERKSIEALAQRITDSGQKVVALAPYWDFSSSDEALEATIEDAKRYLDFKDIFEAKKIRVFAGAPGSAEATQKNWSRAIKGLHELARMYEGSGVTFVIETHGEQLPDTVASSKRLMEELDEPSILLNYQYMKGKVGEEIDGLFEWIAHVHVSFAERYPNVGEETVRHLARRGYAGTVTVEFCTDSLPPEGKEFSRAKAIAGMKRDIALLRAIKG